MGEPGQIHEPKSSRKKMPEPHLKPCPNNSDVLNVSDEEIEDDLTKPAGVMHFLLRKGDRYHGMVKSVGVLGMKSVQEQRMYQKLEKDFHNAWNLENIRQKQIPIQNNKGFYGDEPIDDRPGFVSKVTQEKEFQMDQYEKMLGLKNTDECNEAEDLSRHKLIKVSNQRTFRHLDKVFTPKPNFDLSEMEGMNEEGRKLTRSLALGRFVQAVYAVITRYRASKRIVKLKIMKKKILEARKKALEQGTLTSSPRQMLLAVSDKPQNKDESVEVRKSLVENYFKLRKSINVNQLRFP